MFKHILKGVFKLAKYAKNSSTVFDSTVFYGGGDLPKLINFSVKDEMIKKCLKIW